MSQISTPAESKDSLQWIASIEKYIRLSNKYLVLKNFIGLTFIYFSVLILSPVIRTSGYYTKTLFIFFLLIVVVLIGLLMFEYLVKMKRMQSSSIRHFSIAVALNSFIGFVVPIFFLNAVLWQIVKILKFMPHKGDFWCNLRIDILDFYFSNNIYSKLDEIGMWSLVIVIALFIWGGTLERIRKN